jgi:hypothetical protein
MAGGRGRLNGGYVDCVIGDRLEIRDWRLLGLYQAANLLISNLLILQCHPYYGLANPSSPAHLHHRAEVRVGLGRLAHPLDGPRPEPL